MKITVLLSLLLLWSAATLAQASHEEGVQAFQRKDYNIAFSQPEATSDAGDVRGYPQLGILYTEGCAITKDVGVSLRMIEKSAQVGNVVSMNILANLYFGECGVEKNLVLARDWARRSARTKNVEGALLFYRSLLMDPSLQYIENGKPNTSKYFQLAKRPAGERLLEIEGYDYLALAARLGHPTARVSLGAFYADNVGEENNQKSLSILQSIPSLPPFLEGYKHRLLELQKLGTTLATVKLIRDAQITAMMATYARANQWGKEKSEQCPAEKIKLQKMALSKPLTAAEYLPLAEPGMKTAYLMRGAWEETWTYDVCGREVATQIAFQADGFGGAYFQASGK